MTISQLENFIAVAEAGSFSAAAEQLYISPQALIQQIAKMEAELGFKLFFRNSKGVRLNAAGEEYYQGIKGMLAQYRACTDAAARKAKKAATLRVGLPDNINSSFLLSICDVFRRRHPEIKLHFENYSIEDTGKALSQGRIDICAQIKAANESSFFSLPLFPVGHFCLVTHNHPLAAKKSIKLEDLIGYTAGVWGPLSTYKNFSSVISERGLQIRLQSLPENFSEALIFCVEGNVMLGSAPLIDYLKGSLAIVPFDFDFGIDYYLSYVDENNEVVQAFLAAAKEAADAETHPWKKALSNFPIDK